jgi:GTP-binding protein
MMLRLLDERVQAQGGASHTLQAVITKIDGVPLSNVRETIRQIRQDVFEAAPTCLPPLVTSAAKHPHFGVQELRANMIDACGLGKTSVKRSQN